MEKVRVKFNVSEITEYGNDGGRKIVLLPVLNNSEEDKKVLGNNPKGRVEINIVDSDVKFDMGSYYLDFIKVEE